MFLDESEGFSWNFVSSFCRVVDRRSRYFDECYSNWKEVVFISFLRRLPAIRKSDLIRLAPDTAKGIRLSTKLVFGEYETNHVSDGNFQLKLKVSVLNLLTVNVPRVLRYRHCICHYGLPWM